MGSTDTMHTIIQIIQAWHYIFTSVKVSGMSTHSPNGQQKMGKPQCIATIFCMTGHDHVQLELPSMTPWTPSRWSLMFLVEAGMPSMFSGDVSHSTVCQAHVSH